MNCGVGIVGITGAWPNSNATLDVLGERVIKDLRAATVSESHSATESHYQRDDFHRGLTYVRR
jgi:hypothetical protein